MSPDTDRPSASRAVGAWIFTCAALVLAMVVVGGVTRLTRSGLSITEWRPVTGALPPLSPAAWTEEFAKYQRSPEFLLVNRSMTLEGFKSIFLVEWFHRLLGRFVGVAVLLPLGWFAAKGRLSRRRIAQLGGIFALGGLQGFVGWFMVASGLVNEPHVSHYRLTVHLLMALGILAALVWAGLDELRGERNGPAPRTFAHAAVATLVALVVVTITWGGFMAGLHAGLAAPTFPTMNGQWIPSALPAGGRAVFENPLTVHFLHRALAYLTALVAAVAAVSVLREDPTPAARLASRAVLAVVAMQVLLGALTVLRYVPVSLASMHQANGALLLACAVALLHTVRRDGAPQPVTISDAPRAVVPDAGVC